MAREPRLEVRVSKGVIVSDRSRLTRAIVISSHEGGGPRAVGNGGVEVGGGGGPGGRGDRRN